MDVYRSPERTFRTMEGEWRGGDHPTTLDVDRDRKTSALRIRKLTVCDTKNGGGCLDSCTPQIGFNMIKEDKMPFKVGRTFAAALAASLLIQMQLAVNGYASRKTKIAFTSMRDGNTEIYVMDGDGGNQRRVTVNPTYDRYPAWSPDGKMIAFVSNRNRGRNQIWVIDAAGRNPVRLTDGGSDSYPDWSPDGKTILYAAGDVQEDHDLAPGGIAAMDADGNNKRLLKNRGGIHPSWSPDGDWIAFAFGNFGDTRQVYVMDRDGGNPRQLTRDAGHKYMPSWSPDGVQIAYASDYRIWVMDSDGKNQRRLTKINGDNHPTWSPQSDVIAFHAERKGGGHGIYAVDVTNGAVNVMQHAPRFRDQQPDWLYPGELSVSPEGSRVTIWGKLKQQAWKSQ